MTDPAPSEPTADAPPTTPAGWYPTPAGQQRYWDGTKWTDLPWSDEDATAEIPSAAGTALTSGLVSAPRRRPKTLIVAGAIVVVLLLAGGGWAFKSSADAATAHTALVAKKHAAIVEAQDEAAAKAAKIAAERATRKAQIPGIEASVKAMAVKDVADGVLDGPVLDSTCTPVGGGSTNALDSSSTVFLCFVGTVKNTDGTETGYDFNATMDWSTGEYTYGLGKPNS
jgi:Protein of unknown function (DUF2510)